MKAILCNNCLASERQRLLEKKNYERTTELKMHGKGGCVRGQESVNDGCRTEEGSRMKVEAIGTCALNCRGHQRTEHGQSQAVVTDFLDPLLLLLKIFVFSLCVSLSRVFPSLLLPAAVEQKAASHRGLERRRMERRPRSAVNAV